MAVPGGADCMVKGLCAITGLALLVLSACSPAGRIAERAATPAAAPGAGPAGGRAVTAGTPGPGASPASPAVLAAAATVTITAVGDMMLGNTPDLPPDPAAYLGTVEPVLRRGAQIVFGNLEGTLTT